MWFMPLGFLCVIHSFDILFNGVSCVCHTCGILILGVCSVYWVCMVSCTVEFDVTSCV